MQQTKLKACNDAGFFVFFISTCFAKNQRTFALLTQQPFSYLFYIVFALCPFPLLLGHFARCHLKFCPLFSYSRLFHSLSFWGGTRSFSMSVCFNSRFLTFLCIAFCPFAFCRLLFGHFALCPLEVYSFAYSLLYHSLSFWGSLRSFSMSVCFNSRFLTFFILFFAPLPFCRLLFGTFRPLPFGISPVVFLFSVVSFAVFLGQSSLFAMSVCFNSDCLTFFILFFALCPFPLLLKHFALCPFQFYKQSFARCPLLPPFVVFFLFCVWNSPFALLLTAICCKNLLLDKKFSKNKKSLEIVIKTFDNT